MSKTNFDSDDFDNIKGNSNMTSAQVCKAGNFENYVLMEKY